MSHRISNFLVAAPACLLLVVFSFSILLTGCASPDGSGDPFAQPDAAVALRPGENAWIRIHADQAETLIINKGPGDLEVRIPAFGGQTIQALTLKPDETYRSHFYLTRSIGFKNEDANAWARFHYYISGENVEVAYHGPRN